MKIIFITREGKNSPGARVRCYQTAAILTADNTTCEVFSMSDNLNMPEGANEHLLTFSDKLQANLKTFLYLVKNHRKSIVIINRINYHTPAAFIFCLLNRSKMVLDIDDWEINEALPKGFRKYIKSLALTLTVLVAKKSILCICASTYLYRFIKQINKNTIKIPSCVLDDSFAVNSCATADTSPQICWLGTVHKQDNIEDVTKVIRIFQELKKEFTEAKLNIIATGRYIADIENLVKEKTDIVLFKDVVQKDIPEILKRNDIGLLPLFSKSKFNLSKSPVKLFEYMLAETAVVAIKNKETKTIITHFKTGLLAKDELEFDEAIKRLLKDKSLREELAENAKKAMTEKFNPLIYTKQLKEKLKIYEDSNSQFHRY